MTDRENADLVTKYNEMYDYMKETFISNDTEKEKIIEKIMFFDASARNGNYHEALDALKKSVLYCQNVRKNPPKSSRQFMPEIF